MTDKPTEDAVEALYQRVRRGMDERIANPKCKNIAYTFSQEHEWATIWAVVDMLGAHYGKLGYMHRLDTRPYHVGAKAKVYLTQDPYWV